MKAYFLNTSSRNLPLYAVSVSRRAEMPNELIARWSVELGSLHHLLAGAWDLNLTDGCLVIPTRGYQATSSAGYVEIFQCAGGLEAKLVGVLGFPLPYQRKESLRRFYKGEEWHLRVFPQATLRRIATHKNLNQYTAAACHEGLQFRALNTWDRDHAIVAEGQSNTTSAFEILNPKWDRPLFSFEDIPCEHKPMFAGEPREREPQVPESDVA